MEELSYKDDIRNSRLGCLGSSDGRILATIANLGSVPKSAYKRLAVLKGLIPQTEIPQTDAIRTGDEVEMTIYNYLKEIDSRYESNPRWESERYSRKNVTLLSHPDFVLQDDENKVLNIYECKATKHSIRDTRMTYSAQLFIHFLIGKERAKKLGKNWKVKLFLTHYSTEGLDLSNGVEFDPNRLTINRVRFNAPLFDIEKAMDIVNEFVEDFDTYYEGDEVESEYLPAKVKEQFIQATNLLRQIKEQEKQVKAFKDKLCVFMQKNNVRSIKNDDWSITLVEATESHSFDFKGYLNDLASKHPRKAKALLKTYDKCSKRNAYCKIDIKDKDK